LAYVELETKERLKNVNRKPATNLLEYKLNIVEPP